MINFKDFLQYINEETVVHSHSTHLEDLVLTRGAKGVQQTLAAVLTMKNYFSNYTKKEVVSVKVDGAPACVTGFVGDRFFVASKSIFNKNPKVNFSHEDIDANHTGELANKLKICFDNLKDVVPKGKIYQGDMLFDKGSLKSEKINGVSVYSWHPNTIKYTVEQSGKLGKKIASANLGIVFHTEYSISGEDISTINLKGFDVRKEDFKKSSKVFLMDAYNSDISTELSLDNKEKKELDDCVKALQGFKINYSLLSDEMVRLLLTFTNSFYRANTIKPKPVQRYEALVEYLDMKKEKEMSSKKTEKGQTAVAQRYTQIESDVQNFKKDIIKIFTLQDVIQDCKHMIIGKFNKLQQTNNFLVRADGTLETTGAEGYVIASTSAKGVKLVDRLGFSVANFSDKYKKGF